MRTRKFYGVMAAFVLAAIAIPVGVSQTSPNSATTQVNQSSSSKSALDDTIRKVIQDYEDALARRDLPAILAYYADDGIYYDRDEGRISGARLKQETREAFDYFTKNNVNDAFELKDLYVQQLANDLALANYVEVLKRTADGKTDVLRLAETDIFAFRNGRWVSIAAHTEELPKPVEPTIAGMPVGWERSPEGTADSYSMTVDTTVSHDGKSSASLRFLCGSESNPWGSLSQAIDAGQFKGKRVRLTGWIKTADVEFASLWLRADGERHMLAFDNMADRPAKGTTDWKRYTIVLDIPEEAINLRFGALLQGKGQAWFDDFALEAVGPETPVTAKISDAEKNDDKESMANLKRSTRTAPGNLGFENGTIK